uniref:Uncharacterized protein n=1 Tax=Glossina pallidipes TaxID=7398 RepID=A0A1A9ZCP2_GLOPL
MYFFPVNPLKSSTAFVASLYLSNGTISYTAANCFCSISFDNSSNILNLSGAVQFSLVQRVIQKPRNEMSLNIKAAVATAIGSLAIPPYVTITPLSSKWRQISVALFPPTQDLLLNVGTITHNPDRIYTPCFAQLMHCLTYSTISAILYNATFSRVENPKLIIDIEVYKPANLILSSCEKQETASTSYNPYITLVVFLSKHTKYDKESNAQILLNSMIHIRHEEEIEK